MNNFKRNEEIRRALTIAGSDSGGGAGIQADLKTFAALGVYGTSAITSITAQNTVEVTAVQDVDLKVIAAQIDAVASDIGVDAAKTGMLHTNGIIETVSSKIKEYGFLTVVDPVMISKSGARLLAPEAKETLIKSLLPLATVVTPNLMEAEALTNIKIESLEDAGKVAEIIAGMGPQAVLVKGGHLLNELKAIDVLYYDGNISILKGERHQTKDTHGTGCTLSSAIAAELAKGSSIQEAVGKAKRFVNTAIKHSLRIGGGHGPLNHMAELLNDSDRFSVIDNVGKAIRRVESEPRMSILVAEVQMNIGMALPYPLDITDVAAIEGRITKREQGVKAAGCPRFGASHHIARTILAVNQYDSKVRAAINLKYSEEAVNACRRSGLIVSSYDRSEEPDENKLREGSTTYWGAEQAVKRIGRVPDVIYHLGDWGKEPMIVILGKSALEAAGIAIEVSKRLSE